MSRFFSILYRNHRKHWEHRKNSVAGGHRSSAKYVAGGRCSSAYKNLNFISHIIAIISDSLVFDFDSFPFSWNISSRVNFFQDDSLNPINLLNLYTRGLHTLLHHCVALRGFWEPGKVNKRKIIGAYFLRGAYATIAIVVSPSGLISRGQRAKGI